MSEKDKKYYAENREKLLAKEKARKEAYTPEQKARAKEVKRLNYEKNREARIASSSEYQRANPDRARLSTKKWAEANPDKKKAWADRNRVKIRQYCHMRRSIIKSGEQLTGEFLECLLRDQDNCCNACRVSFDEAPMHLDHIISLSKGGAHAEYNVQLLCRSCNCSKTDKMPIAWAFYFQSTRPFSQL